jgi:predicted nucleotidyltransferase
MANSDLMLHVTKAGFPSDLDLIHLFVGGSTLHGAKVEGYDDLDIYGCYIEPPNRILGLKTMEHFVYSTGSEKCLNTQDDVDITCYSLHRWGELMMRGNPAILHYLYADNALGNDTVWTYILRLRKFLLSKKSAKQYLGFANAQRMRLTGEKGMGKHGQRADLIQKYGYDTKFAMHYIRLLFECRELLKDKYLTLPRPLGERNLLIDIRQGKISERDMFSMGNVLNDECEQLLAESILPENPDINLLSETIGNAYLSHWINK